MDNNTQNNSNVAAPAPGWYPNAEGKQQWWDGSQWGQLADAEPQTPGAPDPNAKPKKPWFKKWWIWVIAVIVLFGLARAIGGGGATEPEPTKEPAPAAQTEDAKPLVEETPEPEPEPEPAPEPEPDVPAEFKSALNKAHTYSEMMHMSKQGIYDQLTSEFGENFPPEAAQYAIDNMSADWNDNALQKAISYRDMMDMSNAAIYDQLVSEYGEQFTAEEAQYAVDNLP